MTRDHHVTQDAEIAVALSGAERTLLKDDVAINDKELERKVQSVRKNEPLLLSTNEIDALYDCVCDASERLTIRKQQTCSRLLDKLEDYTTAEGGDSTVNKAGEELRNGISTLIAMMAGTGISPATLRCHVSLSPQDRLVLLNTLQDFDVIQEAIRSTPDGAAIRLTAFDLSAACFAIADRIEQANGPLAGRLERIAIQLVTALNEATPHVFAERAHAASTKQSRPRPLPKSTTPRLTLTAAQRKVLARIRPDLAPP